MVGVSDGTELRFTSLPGANLNNGAYTPLARRAKYRDVRSQSSRPDPSLVSIASIRPISCVAWFLTFTYLLDVSCGKNTVIKIFIKELIE